jgi:hypothetical protein
MNLFLSHKRWAPRLALFLGCFFLAIPAHSAASPLTWRWSNPLPHGNNIVDMLHTNGVYLQVSERGQIFSSTDLDLWRPHQSHTTNYLRAATYFKGQFIITGQNGSIVSGASLDNLQFRGLGTSDWLEGVAASPDLVVAVGDQAAIYTSANGQTWQRQSPPFNDWLLTVTYGDPGGTPRFIAAGENGAMATSSNGLQWQKVSNFTTEDINKAAWFHGHFWVVTSSGGVFSSSSGLTWTAVPTGAARDLFTIAASPAERLIAGSSELRLRPVGDRATWTNELDPARQFPAPAWTYYSALWDGFSFLVGGRTGMLVEGFKTNSTSPTVWLPFSDSLRNWIWEIKHWPGLFIAAGDRATLMTSPDGITWDIELVPDSLQQSIFLGVGGRSNLAVVVGNAGSIMISPHQPRNAGSTLGIVWEAVSPRPTQHDLQGITAFNDLLVVCGARGTILTSPDGRTWTSRATPTTLFLSSLASFPGGVVAVGDDGIILTSSNGIEWTQRASGTLNWLFRVRYLNGKLIAVGENGVILTSTDGMSWSAQNSGATAWLNDITELAGHYYIVGTQGTVLRSPDLATWTSLGAITPKSLYGAAHAEGRLVVAGVEGVILRTQIVPQTDPILIQYTHHPGANTVTNSFIFMGESDQRFSLQSSTDLEQWTDGPQLEFLDGIPFWLHQETDANPPPYRFFKTQLLP